MTRLLSWAMATGWFIVLTVLAPKGLAQDQSPVDNSSRPPLSSFGAALIIDHSKLSEHSKSKESESGNIQTVEESFKRLGFQVTRIGGLDRSKSLDALEKFSTRVPTNALLMVYYHGPLIGGEQKIQSKYSDAAFLIPPDFRFKNKKEVRSKCVGLYDISKIFHESGCRQLVFLADQKLLTTDNNEFSELQNVLELGPMEEAGQSFFAVQKPGMQSIAEQLARISKSGDSSLIPGLLKQLSNKQLSNKQLSNNGLTTEWNSNHFFEGRPFQLEDWNYFDTKVAAGKKPGEVRVNQIGQVFCWVPPGKTKLGSPESEENRNEDEESFEVTHSKGFWISKYEVTEREYFRATKRRPRQPQGKNYPYANSRHGDAKRMADSLNKLETQQISGWSYALPSEAEWEYACRANTKTAFCFGDDRRGLSRFGNFADQSLFKFDPSTYRYADQNQDDGYATAAPVGSFLPNAWGVHDMHGNVWEWCSHSYREDLSTKPEKKPLNDLGRSIRGGSWLSYAHYCRSAMRNAQHDLNSAPHIGFRIILSH